MAQKPEVETIPGEREIEYLKYLLEEKKSRNEWWQKLLLIVIPVVIAVVGFVSDSWIKYQDNNTTLRKEIATFVANAETFAGVRERVELFNYFFGTDLIHFDEDEFMALVNDLDEARTNLRLGDTLLAIMFSEVSGLDCRRVIDPRNSLDVLEVIREYKALGEEWSEVVTALEEYFEDEALLYSLAGVYAVICPEEFRNANL